MYRRIGLLFATVYLVTFLVPGSTSADEIPFELSVGLKGGAMMQATTEVPDLSTEQRNEYGAMDDETGFFPGFGVGPATGLSLEGRMWHVVGLETGFYYGLDHATGWVDKSVNGVKRGRVLSDQRTNALHIPLLLKANADTDLIKPFFGLGLEFVHQFSSDLEYRSRRAEGRDDDATIDQYENEYAGRNRIEPSSYALFQLATGIEIDLGELRIPFEVRAGYNFGYDESFDSRVDPEQREDDSYRFVYNGEYLAHFGIFTGLMYDFDIGL